MINNETIIGNFLLNCIRNERRYLGLSELYTYKMNFLNALYSLEEYDSDTLEKLKNENLSVSVNEFVLRHSDMIKVCPWDYKYAGNPCFEVCNMAKDNPDLLMAMFENELNVPIVELFRSIADYMFLQS